MANTENLLTQFEDENGNLKNVDELRMEFNKKSLSNHEGDILGYLNPGQSTEILKLSKNKNKPLTKLEQLLKDAWCFMGSNDTDKIQKWFADEKDYQEKKEEIQLDYDIALISKFMDCYKEETENEIPEEVFNKFFNV